MTQWQISALPAQTASSDFKLPPSVLRINTTPQQWKAKHAGKGGWEKGRLLVSFPLLSPALPSKLCLPIPRELHCLENGGWQHSTWGFRVSWAAEDHKLLRWLAGFGTLNHRRVGICVEGQTASSARERGKGALTHRCPEWWRGNWFAFGGTRTTATQPFSHFLPKQASWRETGEAHKKSSLFSFLLPLTFNFCSPPTLKKKKVLNFAPNANKKLPG